MLRLLEEPKKIGHMAGAILLEENLGEVQKEFKDARAQLLEYTSKKGQ